MDTRISVVVPVFNQESILPTTLSAILQIEDVEEFIFVDDGSTDRSPAILDDATSDLPHARVITHQRNRGRAAARNTGFRQAASDVVLFLDADIIPEGDLARAHSRRYDQDSVIGVLSRDIPDALDPAIPFHDYVLNHTGPRGIAPDQPLPFKYFIIGYTSIRRSALEDIGGFDESISYGEDLDLAYRLVSRWPGSLRLAPDAVVHQRNIGNLDERIGRLMSFGRNLPILEKKHPGLLRDADIKGVVSGPSAVLSHPALTTLSRALLALSPRVVQIAIIRHLLAASIIRGRREASRSSQ